MDGSRTGRDGASKQGKQSGSVSLEKVSKTSNGNQRERGGKRGLGNSLKLPKKQIRNNEKRQLEQPSVHGHAGSLWSVIL